MRIEFTLTDNKGHSYSGSATLTQNKVIQSTIHGETIVLNRTKNLSAFILDLREAEFFKQPKTGHEVHAALHGKYHCEIDRVQMALLRMQRKKDLRKAKKNEDGKEQVAYVW